MPVMRAFFFLIPSTLGAMLFLGTVGCNCSDDTQLEPVDDEPEAVESWNRGFYLDMTLDTEGNPWLAYQDRDTTALYVARGTGDPAEFTHWVVEGHGAAEGGMLVGAFDGGYYASIAIDSSGTAHATHWNRDNDGQLRYAVRDGDSWDTTIVDFDGVGQFTSLGLRNDTPIVAYYDYENRSLKVAWNNGELWSYETVDTGDLSQDGTDSGALAGDVGKYADLLVAEDGTTHIAYYDDANGNLKVASGSPGSWTIATWYGEGAGRVGAWPNLTQHEGAVYVSFHDLDASTLLLGRWTGTELSQVAGSTTGLIVTSREFVGPDSATAWVGNSPLVMYHDGVNNDAMLATLGTEGWTHSTFAADGAVGFHNQLQADDSGQLNWACFNHTTTDIHFQRFTP